MVGKASSDQESPLRRKAAPQAFIAGGEIQVEQLGAEEQVDLADVRQVEKGIELQAADPRVGFFLCFAGRRLGEVSPFSMKPAGSVQ